MRIYIFLCFYFLFLLTAKSQESAIKGWVRDNITEQGLIGATVTVKLQDAVITGTVTDADGHFYIKGMAAGRYQLEFSYTGYKAVTLPNVLITSGKETEMDVVMEEGIVLEEAVIVATADKDKAINEMATISARTFSLEEVTRYSGGRNDASRLVSNFAGWLRPMTTATTSWCGAIAPPASCGDSKAYPYPIPITFLRWALPGDR
ncbi:MAG: carboxypeptidase-like regulatory domain-containing protein [Saprospiraceae bacterium]|nr:carboxypeptidase-like regulatory domain-containing protein [Saprospiraceae bacterium]